MKRFISILLVLFSLSFLIAEPASSKKYFQLNPVTDSILLGTGITLTTTMFVCDSILEINRNKFNGTVDNKDDLPFFDKAFMTGYSETLDVTSTVLQFGILAAPVALFAFTTPKEDWFTIGVMYAETILLTNGIKELLKFSIDRTRPYMYYSGAPEDDLKNGRWSESFLSGHTAFTFASAAFSTYVYSKYNSEGYKKYLVGGIGFGLATTVGVLRIASGSHYFSDVIAGAALGSLCGFGIPFIHTILPKRKLSDGNDFELSPAGLAFTFRKF